MNLNKNINLRRTFGIISHPDAGKTTLTEKLLLYGGAINEAGAVKSNKIKEVLSRLHNTSFSYVETTVDYEKQLKQSFLPFIAENHPSIIIARDDQNVSMKEYVQKLVKAIKKDIKLKANFSMVKRYLEYKLNFLRIYVVIMEDLEAEINKELK